MMEKIFIYGNTKIKHEYIIKLGILKWKKQQNNKKLELINLQF